jgi:hypothetical protein
MLAKQLETKRVVGSASDAERTARKILRILKRNPHASIIEELDGYDDEQKKSILARVWKLIAG